MLRRPFYDKKEKNWPRIHRACSEELIRRKTVTCILWCANQHFVNKSHLKQMLSFSGEILLMGRENILYPRIAKLVINYLLWYRAKTKHAFCGAVNNCVPSSAKSYRSGFFSCISIGINSKSSSNASKKMCSAFNCIYPKITIFVILWNYPNYQFSLQAPQIVPSHPIVYEWQEIPKKYMGGQLQACFRVFWPSWELKLVKLGPKSS